MAYLRTVGTLVTRSQKRADREGDPAVDEWKALISEKYGELHSTVAEVGSSYFEAKSDIVTTGAASYPLPAAMLSVISVDLLVNGEIGNRPSLKLLMPQERALWSGRTGDACRYAFSGETIEFFPKPTSGTYRLVYIPQPADLSAAADATEVDVITADGEAFLIWGVAAMARDKGESDLRFAFDQSEKAKVRLQTWAINRALHEPRRRVIESDDYYSGPAEYWYPA